MAWVLRFSPASIAFSKEDFPTPECPLNKDVLSFNYYFRQAMHHWDNFNTEWYRNDAAFNLECDSNEYGIIL